MKAILLLMQINSLQHFGGGSDITFAIQTVRFNILDTTGNRVGIEDVVIVMVGSG